MVLMSIQCILCHWITIIKKVPTACCDWCVFIYIPINPTEKKRQWERPKTTISLILIHTDTLRTQHWSSLMFDLISAVVLCYIWQLYKTMRFRWASLWYFNLFSVVKYADMCWTVCKHNQYTSRSRLAFNWTARENKLCVHNIYQCMGVFSWTKANNHVDFKSSGRWGIMFCNLFRKLSRNDGQFARWPATHCNPASRAWYPM